MRHGTERENLRGHIPREDHEAATTHLLWIEELQQGLLSASHGVIQATCWSYEDSLIFPTAADMRQPSDQPEGLLQLQRDWTLHCQLSIQEGDSIIVLQLR
jgi:hypothetical protein